MNRFDLLVRTVGLLLVLLFAGCAGISEQQRPVQVEKSADSTRVELHGTLLPVRTETFRDTLPTASVPDSLSSDIDLIPPAPVGIGEHYPFMDQPHPIENWTFQPSEGPLPEGKEPVKITDGWRVQIGAESTEQQAGNIRDKYLPFAGEKVHITWVDSWYKVRVGDFTSRTEAETLRDKLKSRYPDAFVVTSGVVTSSSARMGREEPVTIPANSGSILLPRQTDGWRIQLVSLQSRGKAVAAKKQFIDKLDLPVYIERNADRYVVRAGDFQEKSQAEAVLKLVREAGFPDAWIVQTKIFQR